MNSLSDANGLRNSLQSGYPVAASGDGALSAFLMTETSVSPFEFRSLSCDDAEEMNLPSKTGRLSSADRTMLGNRDTANTMGAGLDRGATEVVVRGAVDAARLEGQQLGDVQGRAAARAEMEAAINLETAAERRRLADSLNQFKGVKDRYFAEVEQEVVRLSLAIAARVLHREAQIDPLLLTGVVRVALEKMADRTGVVLRVCGVDVEPWEGVFQSTETSERPRVVEDSRLQRGECVLETKMGTVELGVHVQLEEIEKGFFDLLNHRPVE